MTEIETGLMLQLIQAGHAETSSIMQSLIDSLQWENDRLRAELDLIKTGVHHQCAQPWAPHPGRVIDALYPGHDAITRGAHARQRARAHGETVI